MTILPVSMPSGQTVSSPLQLEESVPHIDIKDLGTIMNALADPHVACNVYPNPFWNTISYNWNESYPSCSPEWFAQQTAKNMLVMGAQYAKYQDRYGRPLKEPQALPAQSAQGERIAATTAQELPAHDLQTVPSTQELKYSNGVLTDTHLYMIREGTLVKKRLPAQERLNLATLLQICLESGLQALWILAGTNLSDWATQEYIEAGNAWDVKNAQYTPDTEYEDGKKRCTYLKAWKRKEARTPGESGREVHLGYAEHNTAWGLYEVASPVLLLAILSYLEDTLGRPIQYKPNTLGKHLMQDLNKGERANWIRPIDLSDFEMVRITKVVDVRWKRPLTEQEMQLLTHLIGADKNSQYPAGCTSVLLGSGQPEHVKRPVFDLKKPLAGVYNCRVSGTSDFNGIGLPHPLQNLMYTEKNGEIRGQFWTYTVKLLLELGYSVEIEEADVWAESHTILRPWAEHLWNARAVLDEKNPLCNRERYKSKEARALAYQAVKPVLNTSLGLLDTTLKFTSYEGATDLYRPDWYALIKDISRYHMFWRIRSFLKKGSIPVGVHADCLYYLTATDDHARALPGMFDRETALGGYKRKYKKTITVAQVAALFNDPRLDIQQINMTLNQYDDGRIELLEVQA